MWRYPLGEREKRGLGSKPVHFSVVEERDRRIAENEAYWRQVNELAPPEPGMLNAVFCECGRLGCGDRLMMTLDEYDAVRAQSTTFVVVPGHELEDVERVVESAERYTVVEKEGEAAVVAIQTDPNA